jgi:hypothetical protein
MKTKLIAALLLGMIPTGLLRADDSGNPFLINDNVSGYTIYGSRYEVEHRDGSISTGTITGDSDSGARVVIPDDFSKPGGILIQGDNGYSRYYGY